jgi:hypothetical protein
VKTGSRFFSADGHRRTLGQTSILPPPIVLLVLKMATVLWRSVSALASKTPSTDRTNR